MPIDFYQLPGSPPCRAVALTAAALDIEMNFKQVNLMNGEHLKPEFLKVFLRIRISFEDREN